MLSFGVGCDDKHINDIPFYTASSVTTLHSPKHSNIHEILFDNSLSCLCFYCSMFIHTFMTSETCRNIFQIMPRSFISNYMLELLMKYSLID